MNSPAFNCFVAIRCLLVVLPSASWAAPQTNDVFGFTQPWKYQTNNLDGVAWQASAHDDALWASGAGLFYIEEVALPAPKTTPLPPRSGGTGPLATYYFRTAVVLSNTPTITSLVFSNLLDDGAVFYLNGAEIKRVGLGSGAVTNGTFASRDVGDATVFDVFAVSGPALAGLREGTNMLAVEVHQATTASSDVVFGSSLTVVQDPARPTYVWLLAPTDGAAFTAATALPVTAAVSDLFAGVTKVEFRADGATFGEVATAPYAVVWAGTSLGLHTLSAVAHGAGGLMATSQVVSVSITPPPAPKLTRGPYLQTGTPTSVVVRWRTDVPSTSRVLYGTNLAQLDQTVSAGIYTTNHSLRLTNLQPATRYYYALGSDAGLLAPAHVQQYYQTSPMPGTADRMRLWVIGDAGSPANDELPQIVVRDAYYGYLGTNHIDVWLQLGDNAYPWGTDAEYQHGQFGMYSNLLARTVTWPALGNHDTANSTVLSTNYPYFEVFDLPTQGEAGGVPSGVEQYYSFDYGNAHFICLDSMTSNRATNGPMANWLRADLAANTNLWLIAFFHHSPYSKGHRDSDTDPNMKAMRENFLPILEAEGVDLVLGGHSHVYERSYLLDGHYGLAGTFSSNMIVLATSGRATNGVGGYVKPLATHLPHQGAVYAVVGCSGMSTPGGALNHPAMVIAARVLGSLCLEIHGNRLDAFFLRETGALDDGFTLLKQNMTNRLDSVLIRPDGSRLLLGKGVPARAYAIETTDNLERLEWRQLGNTRAETNGVFGFTDSNAAPATRRFYRARQ